MNTVKEKSMYRKHIPNGKKQNQCYLNTKQNNITDNGINDTNNKLQKIIIDQNTLNRKTNTR